MRYTNETLLDYLYYCHSNIYREIIFNKVVYRDELMDLEIHFHYYPVSNRNSNSLIIKDKLYYNYHVYKIEDINNFITQQRLDKINKLKQCMK